MPPSTAEGGKRGKKGVKTRGRRYSPSSTRGGSKKKEDRRRFQGNIAKEGWTVSGLPQIEAIVH